VLELRVDRIRNATPRIRTLEFVAAAGADLPPFTAGAHIDVELGNGEERSYSLLNDQSETHRYVVAVLREADGRGGSTWMHDVLREGDVLRGSEPLNNFRLSEAGERHILIAGGIGITPIVSMAARLKELQRDYTVHYCAREPTEAAFSDEIATRHGERAKFYYDSGDPSRGLDVVSLLKTRPSATHVYVCGPAGLIRATREAGRDWPMGTVHYELFKGSEADIATRASNQPFDIVLKRASKTLTVPADRSILDVLKDNGFRVKSLCREGVCGTCRVGVISGKVDHRDDCLDDDDRDVALQVCVSRAMPGETLVLDL
jgi:vanillate O-demethylase ferredoxin subunit